MEGGGVEALMSRSLKTRVPGASLDARESGERERERKREEWGGEQHTCAHFACLFLQYPSAPAAKIAVISYPELSFRHVRKPALRRHANALGARASAG